MMTGEEQTICTVTNIFREFIAARGLNMSRQRTRVLEEFLSVGQQITVDDLFIKLRTKHPTIGRTTVYRNLKLIVECGIARVILVDGTCRYEKSIAAQADSLQDKAKSCA